MCDSNCRVRHGGCLNCGVSTMRRPLPIELQPSRVRRCADKHLETTTCVHQMLDSAVLQAEQTLQEATNNHYEIGVPTGGMVSSVRQSLALYFVEKLVEALSCGEHPDQIQLKVVEGVQQRHPRPFPPAFNCQTEVKTLGKGAGGRYVFSGTPATMAKKGPVSQQLTSVVSVSQSQQSLYIARALSVCMLFMPSLLATGAQYVWRCNPRPSGPLEPILHDSDKQRSSSAHHISNTDPDSSANPDCCKQLCLALLPSCNRQQHEPGQPSLHSKSSQIS